MTTKLRILARNIGDNATLTAVPALLSTLPEAILQRPTERSIAATTTSTASQDYNLAYTANQKVNCAGFTRTNLSTSATMRTRLYQGGSPSVGIYDGGALAAFSTAGLNTDIDTYTDRDFAGYRNVVQFFSELTTVQAATLTLADAANADGFLSACRLWLGKYVELVYDPPFGGLDLQLMDASVAARADDGSHIVDKKWKARKLMLQLEFIPDADLATLFAIARYCGRDKELLLSVYPQDGGVREMYHLGAWRITDSPTFNPWQVGLHKQTMTLEET